MTSCEGRKSKPLTSVEEFHWLPLRTSDLGHFSDFLFVSFLVVGETAR